MKNLSFPQIFKSAKFWAILGFIIVLLAVPLTVWYVSQGGTQNVKQNASQVGQNVDSCGLVKIDMSSGDVCTTSTSSRSIIMNLVPQRALGPNDKWVIDVQDVSYFCISRNELVTNATNTSACLSRKHPSHISCTITAGSNGCLNIAIPAQSAPAPYGGLACGYYQEDMALNFNGSSTGINNPSSCHAGSYNLSGDEPNPPGAATYCSLSDCAVPSNTPQPSPTATPTVPVTSTPIPSNTPTPTVAITQTPTDTPTGTLTPTATPTETPTGTLTPTVTLTPTGTVVPTNTGTPGPTNTPGPTATPRPPVPTLPPTGPSGTLMGAGWVGIGALLVGGLLLLAL